jgi:hypothetical protein
LVLGGRSCGKNRRLVSRNENTDRGPIQVTHILYRNYEPKSPILFAFVIFLEPLLLKLLSNGLVPLDLIDLLKIYALFHATLVGSIVTYRLSPFHPLAAYPGPTINKVSQLVFNEEHLFTQGMSDNPIVERVYSGHRKAISCEQGITRQVWSHRAGWYGFSHSNFFQSKNIF